MKRLVAMTSDLVPSRKEAPASRIETNPRRRTPRTLNFLSLFSLLIFITTNPQNPILTSSSHSTHILESSRITPSNPIFASSPLPTFDFEQYKTRQDKTRQSFGCSTNKINNIALDVLEAQHHGASTESTASERCSGSYSSQIAHCPSSQSF
jgi:hypothetical protein